MKKLYSTFAFALLSLSATGAFAGSKIYVPTGNSNQVMVIDVDKDKIVNRISGTEAAHGLAGVPSRNLLVVGSYAEVDEESNGTPDKPKDMKEDEHQAHHSKKASVRQRVESSEDKSVVSIINTRDNNIIRKLLVPGAVHHVATTPDGMKAVVTHPSTNSVSVIDLLKYEVTKVIITGDTPNYAVAAKDSKTVYVTNAGNNSVSEIDLTSGLVTRNIAVGKSPEHLVMSADGETLFVANADGGTVSKISLKEGKVVYTYPIDGEIHGIDLSENGRELFVAGRENNSIVRINLKTGVMHANYLSPQPYHLKTINSTNKLYISSAGQDKIWVVDQKSLEVIKEISVPDRAHQMVQFKS
jgi:YVTN family beta-propeller protein